MQTRGSNFAEYDQNVKPKFVALFKDFKRAVQPTLYKPGNIKFHKPHPPLSSPGFREAN